MELPIAALIKVEIPLYASSGIYEVWLVNIYEQVIIVYRQPTANDYSEIKTFEPGKILYIKAFSEIKSNVNIVLG
ncbi:Uma2 family endonuclease [Trichormus azollae]|uniref:Uma2 family endonuclease n=1 Tax=Trichormus azollae TaxID=1164 RepID=UPI00325E4B01